MNNKLQLNKPITWLYRVLITCLASHKLLCDNFSHDINTYTYLCFNNRNPKTKQIFIKLLTAHIFLSVIAIMHQVNISRLIMSPFLNNQDSPYIFGGKIFSFLTYLTILSEVLAFPTLYIFGNVHNFSTFCQSIIVCLKSCSEICHASFGKTPTLKIAPSSPPQIQILWVIHQAYIHQTFNRIFLTLNCNTCTYTFSFKSFFKTLSV